MTHDFDISSAIKDRLPDDARNVLIASLQRAELHEDALIIANIEAHFAKAIDGRKPFLKKAKGFFEMQKTFCEYLAGFQNTLFYDDNSFREISQSEYPFINRLIKFKGGDYRLLETIATGTSWCVDKLQRTLQKEPAYQLKDVKTGSYITFLAPRTEAFLHVLMVCVPLERQGNYMLLRRQFKGFYDTLLSWNELHGLQSLCLTNPLGVPSVRGAEWRTTKLKNGDTKLMKLWRRLGGITMPDSNDNRLYFLRFNEALGFKKTIEADGRPSPYRYLYKSIYSKEEEAALKG
ncbi:MAG: hypothetical protein ACPGQC_00780 [Limisphaerales bacterium]